MNTIYLRAALPVIALWMMMRVPIGRPSQASSRFAFGTGAGQACSKYTVRDIVCTRGRQARLRRRSHSSPGQLDWQWSRSRDGPNVTQ
jgi:hypothetical protein